MTRIIATLSIAAVSALAATVTQAQTTCPVDPVSGFAVAQMISPTNGSTLPAGAVTFEWCNANADYFLAVESLVGAHDIFFAFAGGVGPGAGVISVTLGPACAPAPPTGCIPAHGETIYVTLWTLKHGQILSPSPFRYTYTAAPVAVPCVGDCGGSGVVNISDLITGVNIALGNLPASACPPFRNAQGEVDIAQLIKGVSNALNGCPSPPTPTVTVPAIDTPTPTVTPTRAPANTPTVTPTQSGDHFVDNGDGTITDTQTGLIWEKKDQGGGLHDSNTRYPSAGICTDNGEFCQPDAAAATTCNAATGGAMGCAECSGTATCNTIIGSTTIWDWLNQINVASFAGHSDWRIPTVGRDGGTVQLETIVDTSVSGCGSGIPCVPPAFNTGCVAGCTASGCSCTQAERYWSATSIVGNLPFPSAWGVFFRTGDVTGIDKASAFYVRAVRGGS